jgi:biopolymer transport protein ExbD
MGFKTQDSSDEAMAEINVTPLVDVMLVLLIIFMVTVPVMKQAVGLDLPKANSQAPASDLPSLRLNIEADGAYALDGHPLPYDGLQRRFLQSAQANPQPQLLIQADRMARYDAVAQALAAAQRAGLKKVGFVTEKTKENRP